MHDFRNQADEAEVILYDYIGESTDFWTGETYGIRAETFKRWLDEASPKPLHIHIDSAGGDVFQAFAMCSAIQLYPGKVTAHVDGLAASAASYIAVVCDEVVMSDYAYLMIHSAQARVGWANARDLEDTAARLRNVDANLAAIYQKRSKLTIEQVLDYMAAETWFTAAEAMECGLATEVVETEERMAACIDPAMARNYLHVPEGISVANRGDDGKSHAVPTITPEAVKEAAWTILDGKIYKERV